MPTSSTTGADRRRRPAPRLVLFGGKGGVGKTTCAAALAVAEARRGRRVLVLSTDPAHSLGDALGVRLSSRPSQISRHLSAVELNAPRAFARWLATNRQALGDVLEHGTWLERSDIDALMELSIPGVDELMALVEIVRLAGGGPGSHDLVVADTAPTGHTLRLLAAPGTVEAVAGILDDLQQEHRFVRERFGRARRPEAADTLIETIARQARAAGALLRDANRSTFRLVTLPEELAVSESEDALAGLERAGIAVGGIVVNRVRSSGSRCPICDPRRAAEARALAGIRRLAGRRPVRVLRARAVEPRGVRALGEIGVELTGRTRSSSSVGHSSLALARRTPLGATPSGTRRTVDGERRAAPESVAAFAGARLLLFAGKGGVGKTTCAAAAAIRLADADMSRRVLLLSTDPAHSLGDVLKVRLGDDPRHVSGGPPNLSARELDAARALAVHRDDIAAALDEITSSVGSGAQGVGEVLDLAPPGIDELLGMISVVDSLGLQDVPGVPRYDLVVCDMAPTGHALRLLEMPDAAREWVQALMRVLLKYRELVKPGRLARELVELSHSIRRLHDVLRDARQSRVIVVTRAAAVPRLETERLLTSLRRLSLAVPAIVVNALTIPPPGCAWCAAVASVERRIVRDLSRTSRRRSRACAIIQTPLVEPPPRDVPRLRSWAGEWV